MTQNALLLRGKRIRFSEIADGRAAEHFAATPFERELYDFARDFLSESASVTVHTSGSTGSPKPFAASKALMRASARMTIGFLRLKPGDSNLLAMPLGYIAGKMAAVRSIECGLDLIPVTPAANPFAMLSGPVDLCAVTPMQAVSILADPVSAAKFLASRRILIGGGAMDAALTAKLAQASGEIYATYGMTETLSHIALRRISGPHPDQGFRALPGVRLSLSPEGTLEIEAPVTGGRRLVTRDRAVFHDDGSFSVIGRLDAVINTGGIKVQAEAAEEKVSGLMPCPFAFSSRSSPLYGEEVTLVAECPPEALPGLPLTTMRAALGRYERPHWIVAAENR